MRGKDLILKKAALLIKLVYVHITALLSVVFKVLTTKRTVMLVTKNKIRTITLGPVLQFSLLAALFWVGQIFVQSLEYDKIIDSKSDEIARLKSLNGYFEEEFNSVNEKLSKVNQYLLSITGASKQEVSHTEIPGEELQPPESIKGKDTTKEDKRTLNQIKNIDNQIKEIRSIARARIKKVEHAISVAGLNIKKPTNDSYDEEIVKKELSKLNKSKYAVGGPLPEDEMMKVSIFNPEETLERQISKKKFNSEVEYLVLLEKLARAAPFSKPMKNYYISSGFGSRTDPFTHDGAVHHGLDFVGVAKEKIVSPSDGKVILARQFSSYGNAIVIDHGFGITTRYGHLAAIKVQEGQKVKKGDIIAVQGNTGRSTAPHLHYEVRYKNIPLNPRKFLEAGNYIFNDKNDSSYVRS